MSRLADPPALEPSGPTFLPILWPNSRLCWHLPSSRHKGAGTSGLCLPPVVPSSQGCPRAPAESFVLLPGGTQPGLLPNPGDTTFHWWRGNPIQQLSVFLLTIDLPLHLQHQGIIDVFKLGKKPRCPRLQNRAQQYFLVYTYSEPSGPWNFKDWLMLLNLRLNSNELSLWLGIHLILWFVIDLVTVPPVSQWHYL